MEKLIVQNALSIDTCPSYWISIGYTPSKIHLGTPFAYYLIP